MLKHVSKYFISNKDREIATLKSTVSNLELALCLTQSSYEQYIADSSKDTDIMMLKHTIADLTRALKNTERQRDEW